MVKDMKHSITENAILPCVRASAFVVDDDSGGGIVIRAQRFVNP
jgi:hypothetical protein